MNPARNAYSQLYITMPSVSIIIVNYNGEQLLEDCFRALAQQTYEDTELILVDNASTDNSVKIATRVAPEAKVVRSSRNIGFAAGCNLGFKQARGDYFATLNTDTRASRSWLEELVRTLQAHPDAGMCASKLLRADRPTLIDSAGICLSEAGVAWDRLGGAVDDGTTQAAEIFGACAGAALYRREMIELLGGFDESFFIYWDDVDLAWRAQWSGWKCFYAPGAEVLHAHSATMKEGSPFKSYLLARNRIWTLAKNLPRHPYKWFLPIAMYDAAAVLYGLTIKRNTHMLRGRWDGLRTASRIRHTHWQDTQSIMRTTRWLKLLEPAEPPWRVARHFQYLDHPATSGRKASSA